MNGQPGAMTEDSGKRSYTRVTGVIVVAALLAVFLLAAMAGKWSTVETMFDGLLLFAWGLYFTNKGPTIAQAIRGNLEAKPQQPAQPQPAQP